MPHLKHIRLQRSTVFLLQRILHRRLRITRQQHFKAAVMQHQHQAGIIHILQVLFAEEIPRRQHLDIIIFINFNRIPGLQRLSVILAGAQITVQRHGRFVAVVDITAVINIADTVFTAHIHDIAHMVAVMMRHENSLNSAGAGLIQRLNQRLPAAAVANLILNVVAHINHDIALAVLQQNRICLPHIQHADVQLSLCYATILLLLHALRQVIFYRRTHAFSVWLIKTAVRSQRHDKGYNNLKNKF